MPEIATGSDDRKSESSQECANEQNDLGNQAGKYSSIFSQSLFTQKNEQVAAEENAIGASIVG